MATEHFCLRWNNHQSTLVSVFDNLLESGTLVDCTLAADGRYLKAHKVVLSACSPYLGMLLSQHFDKHPIIILKDVKFEELKAMLDYMYRGEVNISQEQLSTFLKAAETLQIKGLTDTGGEEGIGLQPNRPPSSSSTTSATNDDPQSPGPPGERGCSPGPRKRKRNKHSDEFTEGESQTKLGASEGFDRLTRESGSVSGTPTNVSSPSAKNVKREPTDIDGDGQLSVDENSDNTMLSRPGPSNGGGTNNKGSPWILSADSTGEEMQLTPGQGNWKDARLLLCEECGYQYKWKEQCSFCLKATKTNLPVLKSTLPTLTPMNSRFPVLTPLNKLPMLTPITDQLPVLTPIVNQLPVLTRANNNLPSLTLVNDQLPVLTKIDNFPNLTKMNKKLPVLTLMNEKLSEFTEINQTLPILIPMNENITAVSPMNNEIEQL